jgi:nucleotide sugar dehydrogenase
MPHYPGAGVGGECIPVDTWYLISQAEKLGIDSKLMKTARIVNDSMPEYVIELLEEELKKVDRKIDSSKVTVLGLCYKKNIPDIRLSPTFPLLEKLATKNVETIICDPVYEGIKSPINLTPISEAFKDSDVIILMTDHDDFKKIDFVKIKNEMKSHIIIDGRNLFKDKKLKELGFVYRVVGKP